MFSDNVKRGNIRRNLKFTSKMARYLHLCRLLLLSILTCGYQVDAFAVCRDPEGLEMSYNHGERWEKASDNCMVCLCHDGAVSCSPKQCPTDEELTCAKPRKVSNLACCKTCEGQRSRDKDEKVKKVCFKNIRKTHRRKQRGNRKQRRRQGRNLRSKRDLNVHRHRHGHGESPPGDTTPPPLVLENRPFPTNMTRIPRFLRHMCVPKRADHIIYRHIEGKEMFVAFDNAKADEVELWKWKLKKTACESLTRVEERCKDGSQDIHLNMSSFQAIIYQDTKVFRKQMTKNMLFGASTRKQVENFKTKLNETMNCGLKVRKCLKEGKKSTEKCEQEECTHRVVMVMRAFYRDIRLLPVYFDCKKCKKPGLD